MDDLLSEKEQIEQLRSWWSEYGGYVIFGVAAGALLLFGVNYYQSSKRAAELEASSLYESLTDHVAEGKLDDAELVANRLGTDFANTTYAALSKLAMGRLYMDKNRDQDAADVLQAVIAGDADEEVKLVARARLARVLLYQSKPQEVVDLLQGQKSKAFGPTFQELLGDAYHALGRIDDARIAYQSVMLNPEARDTVDQQLVQWKSLDLPEASEDAVEAAGAEETE